MLLFNHIRLHHPFTILHLNSITISLKENLIKLD